MKLKHIAIPLLLVLLSSTPAMASSTASNPYGTEYELRDYSLYGVPDAYKQWTHRVTGEVKGDKIYKQVSIEVVTQDAHTAMELARETKSYAFGTKARGSDIGTSNLVFNGRSYRYYGSDSIDVFRPATILRLVERTEYNVNYDLDGGQASSTPGTANYRYNEYFTLPSIVPTKYGFTFDGWTDRRGGKKKWVASQNVVNIRPLNTTSEDITLYPAWKPRKVTITFNVPGFNVTIPSIEREYMGTFGELPTRLNDEYDFEGWYLGSQRITTNSVVSQLGTIELRCKFKRKTLKVTWIDGTSSHTDEVTKNSIIHNAREPLGSGNATFKHWSIEGTTSRVQFPYRINGDVTFVAIYDKPIIGLHISGTAVLIYREAGGIVGELHQPDKPGYKKEGFYWDNLYTRKVLPTDRVPNVTTPIYAKYSNNPYKITFEGLPTVINIRYNDPIPTLPVMPAKNGQAFFGWAYNGKQVVTGDRFTLENDMRLQAIYNSSNLLVTMPDGAVVTRAFGSTVGTLPQIPEKAGLVASGYADQYGNEVTPNTRVISNMNISYKYTKSIIYLRIVDENDVVRGHFSAVSGEVATSAPTLEKNGYKLLGYSTIKNSTTPMSVFHESQDVYPVWKAEEYLLVFKETSIPQRRVRTGSKLGVLPVPEKAGYKFDGWTYNGSAVTTDTVMVAGGMEIYPKWSALPTSDSTATVTIYFYVDGVKINVIDVPLNSIPEEVGSPPVEMVNDRVFVGWYTTGGTHYKFDTPVHHNMELHARWR